MIVYVPPLGPVFALLGGDHMHFTPIYSSWLNQVELWFARSSVP